MSKFVRVFLIFVGFISVGLGILGIFLPLLPTTPFLLLAAACFSKSSKRFYNWLLSNKLFGKYIKNYREGLGIPLKIKITSISLLWITISLTAFFAVDKLFVRIILLIIAIGVTVHILKIPTFRK